MPDVNVTPAIQPGPEDIQPNARRIVTPGGSEPARDARRHRLTREGMLQVIRAGGSVMWTNPDNPNDFRLIVREEDVPNDVEALAITGDTPEARARVRSDLEAQQAALAAQLRSLDQPPAPAPAPAADAPPDLTASAPADDRKGPGNKKS